MIVYGDPSTQESCAARVARLQKSLSAPAPLALDALRALLIEAGTLEQAVEDALPAHAAPFRRLTDLLAEAFVALERGRPVRSRYADAPSALPTLDVVLTFKLPEGFAFYALYPEAYVQSALTWRRDHPDATTVLVVGLRSIGTTLSAVVAATLRGEGLPAPRRTLRPTGHPFSRQADLPPQDAEYTLVVDEGPGLSGSSMAATADALVRAGVLREGIAFLPGHPNDPGPQASAATRAWWTSVPRYTTPTEIFRWEGRSLEATLAARTAPAHEIQSVEELTGGRWRNLAYADEADWPPVDAPFERRKLLVRRTDGTALLWTFTGLLEPLSPLGERRVCRGASQERNGVQDHWRDATGGWGEGQVLGFTPAPWIEGRPLTRADATPDLLEALADHLVATAGPLLPEPEGYAAHFRLAEMLRVNAEEVGLPGSFPLEEGWGEGPSTTDDRLAPHEWRRLPNGALLKVPRGPNRPDHTVVGRQPHAWAIAAALVEWDLNQARTETLLARLATKGLVPDETCLRFHRAAYAAFRLGLTLQCLPAADPHERKRLAAAELRYREALARALETRTRAGSP